MPERLNVPDTLKSQERACVAPPMVLVGEMGNALCTVTGSSLDWHDALCGHIRDEAVRERWGPSSWAARSQRMAAERPRGPAAGDGQARPRSAQPPPVRQLLLARAAARRRPRAASRSSTDHAKAGDWVELRAEVNVLVVLSTAPHPLDTRPAWGTVRGPASRSATWSRPATTIPPAASAIRARGRSIRPRGCTRERAVGGRHGRARGEHDSTPRAPSRTSSCRPVTAGRPWCRAGGRMRIVDLDGKQGVDALFYCRRRRSQSLQQHRDGDARRARPTSRPARGC